MDIQKEREAFESWFAQYENNIEYASEKIAWDAWQAAKAQAVPASIGDIQSWIAVNSFSALDAVHDNVPIVDANELAKYIDSLALSVSVPEGFVLVSKDTLNKALNPNDYDEAVCSANELLAVIEAQQPSSTSDCPDEP